MKRRHVRATTTYRYARFVERYVNPAVGDIPLRRLRSHHLDGLYESLAATGGRTGDGLAPTTIQEVHMIIRAALDVASANSSTATSPRRSCPSAATNASRREGLERG